MRTLIRYAGLYRLFLAQRFKILLEYRASFLIGATSTIAEQTAGLLAVWVVMRQIPNLNGWTLEQIILLYGLLLTAKAIPHMFADNLWTVGREYIRNGGFDRFLVRPVNPLFHLLADRFCQDGIGYFVIGLALVVRAFVVLPIPLTVLNVLYCIVAIGSGALIFFALNLIASCSAFWIMDSVPVTRLVFDNHEFAKYPLTIYPRFIQVALTFVVPYAFASYYPAQALLGVDAGLTLWLGPFIAILLCTFGYTLWTFALRHYSSTGS